MAEQQEAHDLSPEEIESRRALALEMYNWYAHEDNSVCKIEHLGDILRCVGKNPTDEDVAAWEEKLGCQESGEFTWEQLWEHLQHDLPDIEDEKSKLKAAFQRFDKDDSGCLDVEELKNGLKKYLPDMDDEQLEEFFKVIDVDENGKVDYSEFSETLTAFGVNLDN